MLMDAALGLTQELLDQVADPAAEPRETGQGGVLEFAGSGRAKKGCSLASRQPAPAEPAEPTEPQALGILPLQAAAKQLGAETAKQQLQAAGLDDGPAGSPVAPASMPCAGASLVLAGGLGSVHLQSFSDGDLRSFPKLEKKLLR